VLSADRLDKADSLHFIALQDVIKTLVINKAARELKSRLIPSSNVLLKMKEEDAKLLTNFVDLLEKALMLDPAKRMSARDALLHPFLTSP
jgi:serine/threonine-protein kinase PRP4